MDCLTELGKEAVTKLGQLVVELSMKHFKYLTQHKKITINLEEELKNLKMMKQALQTKVDNERRKGHEIDPIVQKWLSEVTIIENEWQKWISNENNVNKNKKCFGGQCSDLAFNYSLGKQATKRIEYITSLKEEKNKFKDISYPKASLTLGSTFTKDVKSLLSREKIITEVIEKLKDDQVKMISICGMGGVGKTTLVKEVIKTIEKNNLFDEVVMAVVSQDVNYEKIQIQIADTLGMEFKKDSLLGRAMELLERLSEGKRVLIVLDDVWDILDFERIGLQERDKYCKILFTSRDQKVCQNMGCRVNFQVPVLLEDEAWSLFREMAGDVVNKHDINPIAREVAKACGGLPLAIVTVGRALSFEGKSAWEDTLKHLRNFQSSSSSDVEKFVHPRIELSLKFLRNKEYKLFLMLCGLFPEDFDIPIECLLHHAVGLGMFKHITASWEARNQVHTLVDNLKRKFLLLESNVQGCVKMHDIVRNVVISFLFKNEEDKFMVQYNFKSLKEEKLNDIKAISLILDDTDNLESGLECPTLKLFQVRSKSKEPISWPELFFQGMCALKVLSMQHLCIPKLSSLSQASFNLHTLKVEHCDVGDISIIGKKLLLLEVLSLAHSNIKELPIQIGDLGNLRLLDLTDCNDLNFISDNVLIRLFRLEELYFRMDNFPWNKNEVAINELKKISHQLKVVEMKFRGTEILLKDLVFNNLQKFWVYVDRYSNFQRSSYLESNLLQVSSIGYQYINSILMISQVIKKCEILAIEKVKGLKNIISHLLSDYSIPYLKDLRVVSCPNLEYLIDCTVHCNGFPQIQSLSLKNLENLKQICYSSNHHEVKRLMNEFSYLGKMELTDLPSFIGFDNAIEFNELNEEFSVGKLFSSDWMKKFPKLETILLQDCISLNVVFDLKGDLNSSGQALDLVFPQLTKIEISHLKNLSYVWGIVPSPVQGFQNLRFLTISNCDSLTHVFTSAIVRAVTNLERLEVSSCKLIENIVTSNRCEEEYDNKGHVKTIGFNKLCYLSLSRLPKLVSICSELLWLEYPSLKQFDVVHCPMLEISFLPTHIGAKDYLDVTYSANTKDVSFHGLKENNSRSSNRSVSCIPFIPKFIQQGTTSKRNSKEASVTRAMDDHIPYILEMKIMKGKIHMPALEDLFILNCNLLDVLFFLEEKCNFIVLSHMKTIKILMCDKLKTIMATREKREDMIHSFALLESLQLINLPNLVRLCSFGTYESWDKQQFMDGFVEDHVSSRFQPLIDEALFPNLTSLLVETCNNINILFSHSIMCSLEHLQKLEVRQCENMEEIISNQEEIEATNSKIIFPALQHLLLKNLPSLKSFFQGRHNLDFPSLEKVDIEDCPNMELFSRGDSYTPNLEDLTIKIESLSSNYIQKKDINSVIRGFKSFVILLENTSANVLQVASQGFVMLNWTKLHNEGYLIKNSQTNIKAFHKLSVLVPYNEIQMLQNVKELTVSNCDSLNEVFGSGGGADTKKTDHISTTQYQLQNMTLDSLPKLSHIWKHNIMEVASFQKLTNIDVLHCHNLKSLLSHSMARSLVQLKKLTVGDCDMMEEIITKEDGNSEGGNKVKILFPKLEELLLGSLPNLECVCSGDYDYDVPMCDVVEDKEINNNKIQISFPELKELRLYSVSKLKCFCLGAYDYNIMTSSTEQCPNMAIFPYGNVTVRAPNLHIVRWEWFNIVRTLEDLNLTIYSYQNSKKYKAEIQKLETFRDINEELVGYIRRVTKIDIEKCHKLLSCIPANKMHLFSHMRILNVRECGGLEEIFESNERSMKYDELWYIYLFSLPKLKHIWKNHVQILRFQKLMEIYIEKCDELSCVFWDVSMTTSLPNLLYLSVCDCGKMQEIIGNSNSNPINCVIEQQQRDKIIFPRLFEIKLQNLPNLKCFSQSSFPSYVELPKCFRIIIEDCQEMKTFWFNGTLYTPTLRTSRVDNTKFDMDEDVNEVILQHSKCFER